MFSDLLYSNRWHYFFFIITSYMIIFYLFNDLFIDKTLFINSYAEQLTYERIEELFEINKKLEWFFMVLIPIWILLKITFTAICMLCGAFIANKNINFNTIFNIALKAEIVFLIALLFKFLLLTGFIEVNNLKDISFTPLSILNLLDMNQIEPYFIYPLQVLNLFEISYWFLLSHLMSIETKDSFWKSFEFIISTYGFGLLTWVIFIVFISINLS